MQDILKEVKILDDVDYFKEMIENESENLETYDTTRESY
jgi:hypothetical protein